MAKTKQTAVPISPLGKPTKGDRKQWMVVKEAGWWIDGQKAIKIQFLNEIFDLGFCLRTPIIWRHPGKNVWFYALELTRASVLLNCDKLVTTACPAGVQGPLSQIRNSGSASRGLHYQNQLIL